MINEKYLIDNWQPLKDGEPCSHRGCLNHFTHPCEECGRIGANRQLTKEYYDRQ